MRHVESKVQHTPYAQMLQKNQLRKDKPFKNVQVLEQLFLPA